MKIRSVLCILSLFGICLLSESASAYDYDRYTNNPYLKTSSRYDYMYANPPRGGFRVVGRYIISTTGNRYVHSPSRLKGARHAARVNAYNYAYGY